MMKGWVEETLGHICRSGGGRIQTGPFGSQLHESDYQLDGVPVVMPTDIKGGQIATTRIARVSESHVQRLKRHKLIKGNIVYGRRGDIGRQALVRLENEGWLCGTGCLKISLGDGPVSPHYLHLYLANQSVVGWIEGQAVGATMPKLNTGILERIPVIYPKSKLEQNKIVAVIAAYDDLIANNQRRITLLERMAEDIYREWFVRLRFPGHEQVKIEKGVPYGWTLEALEKAFKFYGGATPARDTPRYWQNGDVNWFTPTDITGADGIFLGESGEQCTTEGLANCSSKLFPPYSVMMTSRATIGAIGINLTPACTNQGFITCIPNENYPLAYLYHWLKLGKLHFESLSGGSTFAELTKGTFKRMEILTPPIALVQQFHKLVAPLFKAIECDLKASANLKATRDALLPRLISGKLAVDALDIRFPPSFENTVTPK